MPRPGTPSRDHIEAVFAGRWISLPESLVESGSILMRRELLRRSDLLGWISAWQAEAEVAAGLLAAIPVDVTWSARAIGLTTWAGWLPTAAQAQMLEMICAAARDLPDR